MKAAQTKQDAAQAEANINELRVKYEAIKVFRLSNWLGKPVIVKLSKLPRRLRPSTALGGRRKTIGQMARHAVRAIHADNARRLAEW